MVLMLREESSVRRVLLEEKAVKCGDGHARVVVWINGVLIPLSYELTGLG
jgi:hypothetical protein